MYPINLIIILISFFSSFQSLPLDMPVNKPSEAPASMLMSSAIVDDLAIASSYLLM